MCRAGVGDWPLWPQSFVGRKGKRNGKLKRMRKVRPKGRRKGRPKRIPKITQSNCRFELKVSLQSHGSDRRGRRACLFSNCVEPKGETKRETKRYAKRETEKDTKTETNMETNRETKRETKRDTKRETKRDTKVIDLNWRSAKQIFGRAWATGRFDLKACWAERGDQEGNEKGGNQDSKRDTETRRRGRPQGRPNTIAYCNWRCIKKDIPAGVGYCPCWPQNLVGRKKKRNWKRKGMRTRNRKGDQQGNKTRYEKGHEQQKGNEKGDEKGYEQQMHI